MKPSIHDILDHLAHATHSPRGQHAATDQNYQLLLERIPDEQRPVIGQQTHKRATAFARWSAAACVLLVVGISLAIAGVWYHQHYAVPMTEIGLPTSVPSDTSQEPRTMVYQATPLADITAELSEIYHVSIQIINPELSDYRVTATFSTAETIDEILALLAEIGSFEVRETADGFIIE